MGDLEKIKQQFTIVAAVLSAIVLALLVYLLWPGSSQSAQEAEKAKLQQQLASLDREVKLWQSSNPEKTGAALKLLYANNIPTRWSQISQRMEKLLQEAGVSAPASIHYASDTAEKTDLPDVQRIKVDTTVTGDYAKVARFINKMEQDPLLFVIEKISVSSQAEGGAVSLQVTFDTFLRNAA